MNKIIGYGRRLCCFGCWQTALRSRWLCTRSSSLVPLCSVPRFPSGFGAMRAKKRQTDVVSWRENRWAKLFVQTCWHSFSFFLFLWPTGCDPLRNNSSFWREREKKELCTTCPNKIFTNLFLVKKKNSLATRADNWILSSSSTRVEYPFAVPKWPNNSNKQPRRDPEAGRIRREVFCAPCFAKPNGYRRDVLGIYWNGTKKSNNSDTCAISILFKFR